MEPWDLNLHFVNNKNLLIIGLVVLVGAGFVIGALWLLGKKTSTATLPPPAAEREAPAPEQTSEAGNVEDSAQTPVEVASTQLPPATAPAPVPPPATVPPPPTPPLQAPMVISSSAFGQNQNIPAQYTCDSQDINPPLSMGNAPAETQSLALIMDDLDGPGGTTTHWLLWNINSAVLSISANSVPAGAQQGTNYDGKVKYAGPCPPLDDPKHRYIFKLYALDISLSLQSGASKSALEGAMNGHILAQAQLTGLYGYH